MRKIILIWDGAAYHNSDDFRKYLHQVNGDKKKVDWPIICMQFAPYTLEQNPIETVWQLGRDFNFVSLYLNGA